MVNKLCNKFYCHLREGKTLLYSQKAHKGLIVNVIESIFCANNIHVSVLNHFYLYSELGALFMHCTYVHIVCCFIGFFKGDRIYKKIYFP